MKKLLSTIMTMLCVAVVAQAQNPQFSPATFSAEDEVTMTIDVTGTPMAGQPDAYIWIWANPGGVGPTPNGTVNGDWTNSTPAAKLTAAGTNKFTFKFTGTTLFGLAPADLHDFGFLLKAKDGSKQTSDYKPFSFDPLVFIPTMLRIFPSKVDKDDVVTLNFDQSLGTSVNEQRMTPVSATVTVYDDANNIVGNPLTVTLKKTGTTIWSAYVIPSASFTPAAGKKLTRFTYHFNGTVTDSNGAKANVSSADASITFTPMK